MNKRFSYLIVALMLLLGGGSIWAQDPVSFTIGDLKYTVIDAENRQVEVGAKDDTNVSGNITIPAQVTNAEVTYNVVRTRNAAFYGCTNLTGITLSEGIVQINGASFEGCSNLARVSLPNTLTSIGGYGFNYCSSLKSLVIPGSVVAFPDACWETFSGIEFNSITFESCATALPSNLNVNAKNVVLNRNGGRFFGVETAVVGGLATEVSNEAFNDCDNLTSVTINDNVTRIGDYAFYSNDELVTVTINSPLESIGTAAFQRCNKLANIVFPSSLTTIGDGAFFYCQGLKELTIPASVTTVGGDAFGFCVFDNLTIEQAASTLDFVGYKLAAVNAVVNRPTITNESGYLFYNHLQTLTVGGSVTSVPNNFVQDCVNLTTVTLGSSVTSIGDQAFWNCAELATVDIQGNITSIGAEAFSECYKLANITLPSTLQSIGDIAFNNCRSLTNLTIPSSVATLGNDAFAYCVFDNLVIENSNTLLDLGDYSLNAHNAYIGRPLSSDRGEIFWNQAYNGEKFDGTLEIGGNVTTLTAQYAHNLSNMTKLILGGSVLSIEEHALKNCASLADMYVPWQTPLAINENVFIADWNNESVLPQNATLWVPAGTKAAYLAATGWNMFDNIQPTHYIVNLNTVGDGTLKVNDTSTRVLVAYDATNIDFVLAAGEDYDFASLNDGTSNVYTPASQGATKNGGTYTLLNISDDMTFTATFSKKPQFTISATATGGTATPSVAQVYRDRDAYVTFAANEGHELTAVTLNEADVLAQVADNRLNLTNIQANQTVVATFTRIHYSISKDETTNGTIVLAVTDIQWGDNTTATITPNTGYDIDHVTINGVNADSQLNGNTLTISNVKANTVVGATFKKHAYTISTAATTNGTIVLASTSVLYQEGTTATITPATGYDINEVTINGADAKSQLNGNTLTISNVTANITVAATFTKHAYTISAAATTNGTIELTATSVLYQEGTTATITPASGYMVETVTINGGENLKETAAFNKSTGVLTISNVTADTEVSATFRIQSYEVHITGTGVTASNMFPQHNEVVTITVAEDPDRRLTSLKVNDVERMGDMNDNILRVTATGDLNVVATFESTVETITVNANGVGTYCCDTNLDFTGNELKAYIAIGFNKNTGTLLLSREYDIPAGTPIYLKGAQGTYKVKYSDYSYNYYVNMLKRGNGTLPATEGIYTNFFMKNGAFTKSDGTANVGTKRAYLQIPTSFLDSSAGAKINIEYDDEMIDGIEDYIMFDQRGNDRIYNLNGQQINKAGRGVYIVNGKKVINK